MPYYGWAANLSPYLQYPLELIKGHDARGWDIARDRIVDERPFSAAIYPGGYTDEQGRQRVDWRMVHFLSKVPGSRWLSSIDRLFREDKGQAEKAASLLLGLNLVDVDEEEFAAGLRKDLLRELKRQKKDGGAVYEMLSRYAMTGDWRDN